MPFRPDVDLELIIDGVSYHTVKHPAAPGMPYGMEGRQAVVYQLVAEDGVPKALKVFRPRYRTPSLVSSAEQIAPLADLPGLRVCRRTVLSPRRYHDLLRQHPDLAYAVLMPWVEGDTWQEMLLAQHAFTSEESLHLARALADMLALFEEQGIAHCDLSGANLMLTGKSLALVDLEGIYAPGLLQPEALPAGSPGYAHCTTDHGMWERTADRFAGAVLLTEILAWCDPEMRELAWGESLFAPDELQQSCDRYRLLDAHLRELWGRSVAEQFARAWQSDTLRGCPTFGEWLVALPDVVPDRSVAYAASETSSKDAIPASTTEQDRTGHTLPHLEQLAGATTSCSENAASGEVPVDPPTADAQRGWRCPNCGQMVADELTRCPYCELGERNTQLAPWHCAYCGADVPGDMAVCPECERPPADRPPSHPSLPQRQRWVRGMGIVVALVLVVWGGARIRSCQAIPVPTRTATPISKPANSSTLTPTAAPTPTSSPTPTASATPTATATPTLTPTATQTTTSTPTETPTPTSSPSPVVIVAATTTPISAPMPEPLEPASGAQSKNPIAFSWHGSLEPGQSFLIQAWHAETAYLVEFVTQATSYAADVPANKIGAWRWHVAVVNGDGSVLSQSSDREFWFNPVPGARDSTEPSQDRPTPGVAPTSTPCSQTLCP